MKRTTILLPDELATLVELERRRRDVSATTVVREALAAYFAQGDTLPKKLRFIGIGSSHDGKTAERVDEALAEGWAERIREGWNERS